MLPRVGPSPVPREERDPLNPPWTPQGEPVSKERGLSTDRSTGCHFLSFSAKTLDQGQAFPGKAGNDKEKFLKTEASQKNKRGQTTV